uniref:B30.2/SPRY domain-containing protein n=1 Tax=Cynoglossus semilaevis TaxID=244447 RepID=A0A3P8WML7_CYNSE
LFGKVALSQYTCPQLIQLWNLQPTIKPCISPRTHTKSCEPQKISELNYRDNLLLKQDTDQNHLLPARGCYYWETNVSQSTAYRLGVAYSTTSRESSLGENTSSWCLQYQLLHSKVLSTVLVIETPERVGTLLDYQRGRLSFYNSQSGQLLGSFSQLFPRPCHPALALELPGSLELSRRRGI